jgi:hypothetical protein
MAFPLYFTVFDNPMTLPTSISPGPGGLRQSFTRVVNRVASPFKQQNINEILERVANGTPQSRLYNIDLAQWFAMQFAQVPAQAQNQEQAAAAQAQSRQIMNLLSKTANDPNSQVRAWSAFALSRCFDPAGRRKIVDEMLRDSAWESRALAMVILCESIDPAQWKEAAGPLAENDPDPLVKKLAAAVVAFADNPAATQPATPPPGENEQGGPMAQP